MLSVAPLEIEADVPQLEDYLAQEHEMGPIAPQDIAGEGLPPAAADECFAAMDSCGEGEDDGSQSDPGSGDPGSGDPGAGDPGAGDPGAGDPGAGDPADGGGDGVGEDTIEDSGGLGLQNAPPTIISLTVTVGETEITLVGYVTDDGPLSACSVSFGGLVDGTVGVDEQGSFSLSFPKPESAGDISAFAGDGELNSDMFWTTYDAG